MMQKIKDITAMANFSTQATLPLSKRECRYLKGIGPKLSERLEKIGIKTWQEVLFHLPLRYEDRTKITPLNQIKAGYYAQVEGEITHSELLRKKRASLLCQIDGAGRSLFLRFFHFHASQREQLKPGAKVRCYGEVRFGAYGLEMVHPEYQMLRSEQEVPLATTLTPVYPTTEGISQATWLRLTEQILEQTTEILIEELLPKENLGRISSWSLLESLRYIHRPPVSANQAELLEGRHPAQQRLAFEELLAHHISLQRLRQQYQYHQAPAMPIDNSADFLQAFLKQLPFQLTHAQQRVLNDIQKDLAQNKPMLRLVQGDVGSGKTVVAAIAALQAIYHDYQVAVMAPTEILAEQHYKKFKEWFSPNNTEVAFLTSSLKKKEKDQALECIASGSAKIAVGTHALFQEMVQFNHLGLVIIDEQHRFGVHQRMSLRDKGVKGILHPHQLIMTATPIPRTLAMCAYADLDQSIIDELPPGRQPVKTVVISNQRRQEVIERIKVFCAKGQQVYWVCTLIEESEVLQCQAAEKTYQELQQMLAGWKIGLVHGRLKSHEKDTIMQAFKQREISVLVATTVIEVGVDVPNATLMVIENPERLGLAQLHQLRGRVGRGSQESHCVLLYQNPLSHHARERLEVMRQTNDGFKIAEKDLTLRGPGEVLGTRQTGDMSFKIADLLRDENLIPDVQAFAKIIIASHPQIIDPLIHRWLHNSIHYGQV